MPSDKSSSIHPRIIIHGGAGNITRQNLPRKAYNAYRSALLSIVHDSHSKLTLPGATALDIAAHAVTLLENNGLFNSGHGAVYTTAGTHELEASVMVSRGYRKRGVGVMKVGKAKNPILLARAMLIKGEEEDGGGAQGHVQLHGETCDQLVEKWGLEIVKPSYFWTRRRWDEHRKGLGLQRDDETYERHKAEVDEGSRCTDSLWGVREDMNEGEDAEREITIDESHWNGHEYLPQGTVGAVVLDSTGTICVATSTGGLTNKLPGRIGDTPTIGAGFFAEEWHTTHDEPPSAVTSQNPPPPSFSNAFVAMFSDCLPGLSGYTSLPAPPPPAQERKSVQVQKVRAVAMSGTGNGDSFLRLSAVRTAASMARFLRVNPSKAGYASLQDAVSAVAGPEGMLQESAEDRWLETGEGEGGIIGIDFVDGKGEIVFDYNCGGMFHAWVDDKGIERFRVFKDEIDM